MSTTGHYTRYINQFPGWSDNCDTMFKGIYSSLLLKRCDNCYPSNCAVLRNGKKERYCQKELGHFTIEHTIGNKRAYLTFGYDNNGYNYWQWIKEQTEFIGPLKGGSQLILIDYTGDKAIQHVMEESKKITVEMVIDLIFKNEFYNRSYVDYFRFYLSEVEI